MTTWVKADNGQTGHPFITKRRYGVPTEMFQVFIDTNGELYFEFALNHPDPLLIALKIVASRLTMAIGIS